MFQLAAKVDLKGIEDLRRRFPEASRKAQEARITEAALLFERAVKLHTPEGAGPVNLRETIFHKIRMSGERIWGIVGTPVKYGEALELGTKPHYPPRRPIIWWAARKLGLYGLELRHAVRAIQWKIYRHGTEGAHMFEKGFEENESEVKKILKHIPADIIRSVNK